MLPLIGGDTDVGIGAGAFGSVVDLEPGFTPFKWKLEFGAFYATKGGLFQPSYEDAFVTLTLPGLFDNRLRLRIRPSFTRETALPYFGLGNAAHEPTVIDPTRDYYTRLHPALSMNARWAFNQPVFLDVGAQYTYNTLSFDPSSTLAQDMHSSDPYIRDTVATEPHHSVLRFQGAVVYDTRDNVVSPYNGQYHRIQVRVSPRLGEDLPYSYQQIDAQARFYYTPIPRYLTLTARGVFDLQLGDLPFYELARYEETSAIGGGNGVRGVPAYSYYGKVKAFANFEARSETFHITVHHKPYILGFAVFYDAGRLWTDLETRRPVLDGTGLGLHYGIGGGLRLQEGHTFVVRADLAWSPDARPVGAYLIANQVF